MGLRDPRDTLTPRLTTSLDLGFLPPSPAGGGLSGSGRGPVLKSVVFWRPFGVSRRLLEDGHPRSGREFRDHRGSCVIARGVAEFSSVGLRAEGAWDRPLLGLGLARGRLRFSPAQAAAALLPLIFPPPRQDAAVLAACWGDPGASQRCLWFGASLPLAASRPALFLLQSPHPHPPAAALILLVGAV